MYSGRLYRGLSRCFFIGSLEVDLNAARNGAGSCTLHANRRCLDDGTTTPSIFSDLKRAKMKSPHLERFLEVRSS